MRKKMTSQLVRSTLTKDFKMLSDKQLENLSYHEKRKTPIACGRNGGEWFISRGG